MLKMGLLGASTIAPTSIISPARTLDNVCISGIAASDISRAQSFSEKHSIPHTFTDYQALIESPEIDAVYISLSNDLHATWLVKAIQAGKHVLIEKPACLSMIEMDKVCYAAKPHQVLVLEAVMVNYHPWVDTIKDYLETGIYGDLKETRTIITYPMVDRNSYRFNPDKGGGVFFDEIFLWCHLLQIINAQLPESVIIDAGYDRASGVDVSFKAHAYFKHNFESSVELSYQKAFNFTHEFIFEKFRLRLRNFIAPVFGYFSIKLETFQGDELIDKKTFEQQNYYRNQLGYFLSQINKPESYDQRFDEMFDRMQWMDYLQSQWKSKNNATI